MKEGSEIVPELNLTFKDNTPQHLKNQQYQKTRRKNDEGLEGVMVVGLVRGSGVGTWVVVDAVVVQDVLGWSDAPQLSEVEAAPLLATPPKVVRFEGKHVMW